ncbi:sensor histidine kinase [Rhizobacter sp. Root1221]|uniref:sensor histidine kinase n=1 Tax=Rhizobacter sp. Root1221 TaxID=1736433 RepID=UPI000ABB8A81|nr:GAF domain-containing sensor histidine kinase [Rhizobacter sp. Root1221]
MIHSTATPEPAHSRLDPLPSALPSGAQHTGPVDAELALVRAIAGMRTLLALLGTAGLLTQSGLPWFPIPVLLVAYATWSVFLLWQTLDAWPRAGSVLWPWTDAAALLAVAHLMPESGPLLADLTVLPVVALALIGGAVHAAALASACAAIILLASWQLGSGAVPPLALGVPLVLLALGPAAAFVARPTRDLRLRLQLLKAFKTRSDPRQGLRHHVNVLLQLLAEHFRLGEATISLQGPQPRIIQWRPGSAATDVAEGDGQAWRDRLAALPRDLGCLCVTDGSGQKRVAAFDLRTGAHGPLAAAATAALHGHGMQAMALPLMSYGQPLGHLWLHRDQSAFKPSDLQWLHAVMRDTLPLLERSDLLEQLQRETASRERERIGRDLHDSAVQPYLGLKYGLEALARNAGPDNAISPQIQELLQLATQELETLRDVVSGLRSGDDPNSGSTSLVALQRQVARFQALYGLKVHIFAPQAPHLRGSAARAVLHMVNEALTNVRRHTTATAVTILFDVHLDDVVLRLRNDHGPGGPAPRDFLPRSLTERAAEFGGTVCVTHEANFTELAITLPLLGAIG